MGYSNKLLFSSKHALLGLVALLVISIAAGCGGGGDSSSSTVEVTTSSLSKAAFIKQANAICTRARNHILRVVLHGPIKELKGTYATEVEAVVNEIQALGAPSGDEGEVSKFLTGYQQAIAKGSRSSASTPIGIQAPYIGPSEAAIAYGLAECTL